MTDTIAAEHSVVAIYGRLLEAWNARDARKYAALFTPDAHVTGFDGSQMNSRPDIESELTSIFANHPTASYVGRIREIRPLGPTVTLLRAVVGMVPPGETAINAATNAIQSLVIVTDQPSGEPQIAFLQNTPAAFHGRPDLTENLTNELSAIVQSGHTVHPA